MISPLNLLRSSLQVQTLDDDRVSVTVTLPRDLVPAYCHFLESLSVFFRSVDRQSTIDQAKTKANQFDPESQQRITEYRERLGTAFDSYTSEGLSRQDAIKQISSDLRAEKHPWRTVECIRSTLVSAGRSGRPGRPRQSSESAK